MKGITHIFIVPHFGATIADAVTAAINISDVTGETVKFNFNGTEVTVDPQEGPSHRHLVRVWCNAQERGQVWYGAATADDDVRCAACDGGRCNGWGKGRPFK